MVDNVSHSPIVDVNEADFDAEVEQSALPVFIDFWASWCGPCRALEPLFKQLAEAYRGQIKFVKVNADDNNALCERFNVRGLPTLLLLRNGEVVEKASGRTKAALTNLLDAYAQRPIATKAAPQRSFCAFHGDTTLRDSVVARLRERIQALCIVQADHQQRYGLMSAALNDADLPAFENALGIPGQVGRLQEAVHGLLLQETEVHGTKLMQLQAPHDAWPLDWWQTIPPGADLQSLPSRFIAWLLRERSTEIYPYVFSDDARTTMESLAKLHVRYARGDTPTDEEWRTIRRAAGDLAQRGKSAGEEMPGALAFIEMLAWPAHELDDALTRAVSGYLDYLVTGHAIRTAYTPEQWAARSTEREALQKTFEEKVANLSLGDFASKEEGQAYVMSLDEYKAITAHGERCRLLDAPVRDKARLAYAERLHTGLMQALNDTVSEA